MSMFGKDVELIPVIRTTLTRRGDGKSKVNPIRAVTQYWTLKGELLAEVDPCAALKTAQQAKP